MPFNPQPDHYGYLTFTHRDLWQQDQKLSNRLRSLIKKACYIYAGLQKPADREQERKMLYFRIRQQVDQDKDIYVNIGEHPGRLILSIALKERDGKIYVTYRNKAAGEKWPQSHKVYDVDAQVCMLRVRDFARMQRGLEPLISNVDILVDEFKKLLKLH
jgi:hypothetical protein